MMEMKMKIQITELETFKNFLGLIEQYFDELPKELQERIAAIEYTGINDIDATKSRELYGNYEVYENSLGVTRVQTINRFLKRVVHIKDGKQIELYPEHFWNSFDGVKVVEW